MVRTWEQVKDEMFKEVKFMERMVSGYSYEDRHAAMLTDEKFCNVLDEKLKETKDRIFSIIELFYEIGAESMNKPLENLKTDVEIFSDEIKIRHCEWELLSRKWVKKIVSHDYEMIRCLEKLNIMLEALLRKIFGLKETDIDGGGYDKETRESLEKSIKEVYSMFEKIVRKFKEREAVCNIKSISFEKIYQKIKKDINTKI